jgi:transglutaminase-like putative cysteine protease
MRRLKIEHVTTYTYKEDVKLMPHRLLVRPREGHDIRIESSRLSISPFNTINWRRDTHGNSLAQVSFNKPSSTLLIESEVIIQHYETPLDFIIDDYAIYYPFHYPPGDRIDLIPYEMMIFSEDSATLGSWVANFWKPGDVIETYRFLSQMNKVIANEFNYAMREEPGVQSPAVTLEKRSGSCRDFATLFIEACRYVGLAARFVSGYLYTPVSRDDHGSTHAWSEVYLPGAGWKGFDNTSGLVTSNEHIAVAVNRHPEAIPPISGSYVGPTNCLIDMTVDVKVTQV